MYIQGKCNAVLIDILVGLIINVQSIKGDIDSRDVKSKCNSI
jgi:hypothetical protein